MTIVRTVVSHPSYGGTLTLNYTAPLPGRLSEYVRQEWPGLSDAQREGVYGEYLRYLTTGEGNAHTAAIMSAWMER